MIEQLHIFSSGQYIIADEWNANFKVIDTSNKDCAAAVGDANGQIAFPGSDLTQLFGALAARPNSFHIPGNNVIVSPQCEYYKAIPDGVDLNIQIPNGFNSEAMVLFSITNHRDLIPITISYDGNLNVGWTGLNYYPMGYYFAFIYEIDGTAIIKLCLKGE